MPPTHSIRLRHPWQCETAGEGVIWSRIFNWPAELEAGESVWLVIEPLTPMESVLLNGKMLSGNTPGRFDITAMIDGSNRLTISCTEAPNEAIEQCPFEVRLEIVDS